MDAANLRYGRAHRVNFKYATAPLVTNVYPSPSGKDEGAGVIYRNLERPRACSAAPLQLQFRRSTPFRAAGATPEVVSYSF